MFTQLLESRTTSPARTARTRAGGTLCSAGVHATVITALVVITARARPADEPPAVTERLRIAQFTPRPPEPIPSDRAASAASALPMPSARTAAPALAPRASLAIDIPNTIPAIDLTRPLTTEADFAHRGRGGSPDGFVGGIGRGTMVGAGGYFSADQVEKTVLLLPGTKGPVFPDILRTSGTEGLVLAQFVVDTTGRADPASFSALRSDHPLFTAAVQTALARMRFIPAEIGERKVPQLVQLPFQFQLDGKR